MAVGRWKTILTGTGFEAGIYIQCISNFMEPYVVPQENGNRTDVRWMLLADKKKAAYWLLPIAC
jgi:hypothetical protein